MAASIPLSLPSLVRQVWPQRAGPNGSVSVVDYPLYIPYLNQEHWPQRSYFYWPPGSVPSSEFVTPPTAVQSGLSGYYPQWMNLHWEATSVLNKLLGSLQIDSRVASNDIAALLRNRRLRPLLGEPYLAWSAPTSLTSEAITGVVLDISGQALTRSLSLYQFLHTQLPTYYADTNSPGNLYFRNLATRTRTIATTGQTTLLDDPFYPGEDVYWRQTVTTRIPAERVDFVNATVTFPVTGTLKLTYVFANRVATLTANGTVTINRQETTTLTPIPLWNSWDERALATWITRFPGEDNVSLARRVASVYRSPGGTLRDTLRRGVARDLGLLSLAAWNSTTDLSYPASSLVTDAYLTDFTPTLAGKLASLNLASGRWYAPAADWLDDSVIFVNGALVTPTASAGAALLDTSPGDSVQAVWRATRYRLTANASGYITALTPTRNILPGSYVVGRVQGMDVATLTSKPYLNRRLFTPADAPTGVLQDIAETLATGLACTLGYGHWGRSAWLTADSVQPEPGYIPMVLD